MKPTSASHWLRARVLLIDEVSMIDGEYFDYVRAKYTHNQPSYLTKIRMLPAFPLLSFTIEKI